VISGAFRCHGTLPGVNNAIPSVPAWTAADLRRLISADRFERYLADAAGSPGAAAGLYAWSGRVAGAVYEELGMVEVVLRNILNCQLCRFHRRRMCGSDRWWAEPQMPWAGTAQGLAARRAGLRGPSAGHRRRTAPGRARQGGRRAALRVLALSAGQQGGLSETLQRGLPWISI
jgi:hypothetical protein